MKRGGTLAASGFVLAFFTVLFEYLSGQPYPGMLIVALLLVLSGTVLSGRDWKRAQAETDR